MSHRIAMIATMLLAATTMQAQEEEEDKEKSNGVRVGYHMSDLEGDDDLDTRSGYYIGYYRNFIKVPIFSLSAGLEFNTAGATLDNNDFNLSYLGVPINGRIKLGPFYGDLGVDLAFLVSEKWLVDGDEFDIENEGESFDALAHVGLGFKFLFMGVEARYRYGLTEVYDGTRNTGLQVGLVGFF